MFDIGKFLLGKKPRAPTNTFNFKAMHSFDKRLNEAQRVINKNPGKIPIIIEKSNNSDTKDIEKHKWLLPEDFKISQLLILLRKHIELDPSQALFIFVDNTYLPRLTETMGSLYDEYKNEDKFMYCTYSKEETFG